MSCQIFVIGDQPGFHGVVSTPAGTPTITAIERRTAMGSNDFKNLRGLRVGSYKNRPRPEGAGPLLSLAKPPPRSPPAVCAALASVPQRLGSQRLDATEIAPDAVPLRGHHKAPRAGS
jgi:hypothetical protein